MRKIFFLFLAAALVSCSAGTGGVKTRGIGVYPGDPSESFAPAITEGSTEYRNIALGRAATHSSSYDYNLTAQLVTDGVVSEGPVPWVEVLVDGKALPKAERELLLDGRRESRCDLYGTSPTVELRFHGMDFNATKVEPTCFDAFPKGASSKVEVSESDGTKIYRIDVKNPGAGMVMLNNIFFYDGNKKLDLLPSNWFHSAWMSEGAAEEWVRIDLGAVSDFDKMVFRWENPPVSGKVQVSDDDLSWKDAVVIGKDEDFGEISLPGGRGRYVRAILDASADGKPYILSEWEVYGKGGISLKAAETPSPQGGKTFLSGGGWKLQRSSLVEAGGEEISSPSFDDESWLVATVPGTVLASYVNAGAVPDPNFADNQNFISESWFRSDFWYRDTFDATLSGEYRFLHFDGINFKAEVYLNGQLLGNIDGAFREGEFNVTDILMEGRNDLAVKILKNNYFGAIKEPDAYSSRLNGGILGLDNPTMHPSIGWDWIPTVRGRNMGIWDDVYIEGRGPVAVKDPFVRTELPLPDTASATVYAEATLENASAEVVSGVLKCSFGDIDMTAEATLGPGEKRTLKLNPEVINNPRLWWPNGYGPQELYPVSFSFETGGTVSDRKDFQTGIRQMDFAVEPYEPTPGLIRSSGYPDRNERLSLFVNGRRLIGFGGNWGFPEHMMNYRGREYEIAARYHADMNFTMIRNWVGQTADREFYEACDKYGIMVWQDFWLANPWDGPNPEDPDRFNATSEEYVRRIRNHPCIALYVGRNEGNPPAEINDFLVDMLIKEHPGMAYIPHSAAFVVSGGGPYNALPAKDYFHLFGHDKMHSERGMPNIMNYENLARTLGDDRVEPYNSLAHPNSLYGLHNYNLGVIPGASAAQRAESFNGIIEKAFGEPSSAKEFAEWAQWLNYDGYRAMFEGRGNTRRGLLLWMSHPAWPSLVWQTYDYYFEPTAAYFGCKKACEPIHIQWNPYLGNVEVVNYRAGDRTSLTASAEILGLDGAVLWNKETSLDSGEDSTVSCFPLEVPSDVPEVYFIRLSLMDSSGEEISGNFYWQGREEGNLKALRDLPAAKLKTSVKRHDTEDGHCFSLHLENKGSVPALMLRIKVLDGKGGDLVLPVMYSDNYIFLMPGESREITASVRKEDCSGKPCLEVSGFNL